MDIFGEKIKHIKFGIGKIISFKEQKNRDGETTGILVSINFEKEIKNLAIQKTNVMQFEFFNKEKQNEVEKFLSFLKEKKFVYTPPIGKGKKFVYTPPIGDGDKEMSTHKECGVFLVYQGVEYEKELVKGYLSAAYEDKGGGDPYHWKMLEEIKEGDVIFHCVKQYIVAVSVATSKCFKSKIRDGIKDLRQVNCKPFILNDFVYTKDYLKEIKETCSKYKYQPFDKNGDGKQGYMFDLNDKLAGFFARAVLDNNPNIISSIPELNSLKEL